MSLPGDKHKPKIPEGYFSKFDDELDKKLMDEDTFQQKEFPLLFSLQQKEAFAFPDRYFETFKVEIDPKSAKSPSKLKVIAFAAALLIAGSIFGFSLKKEKVIDEDKLKTEEILRYFAEEDGIFDSYYEEDLSSFISTENQERFGDIEEEILINYLNENADEVDLALLY